MCPQDGKTALDIAKERNKAEIVALLDSVALPKEARRRGHYAHDRFDRFRDETSLCRRHDRG